MKKIKCCPTIVPASGLVIACLLVGSGRAQSPASQVVASGGGFITGGSGSLSFTIGETFTQSFTSSGDILSQGFQQPLTAGKSLASSGAGQTCMAYPNPANNQVFIEIQSPAGGKTAIDVYDDHGRLLISKEVELAVGPNQVGLVIATLTKGLYFIKVTGPGGHSTITLMKM
jgi:hypothetical protein